MTTETTAAKTNIELAEARTAFREALAAQDRAFERLENSTAETVASNEMVYRAFVKATNKAAARVANLRISARA